MKQLMPLKRVVVEVTHEAQAGDLDAKRKAIKSWHNRLSNRSIPRSLIRKLGKELYLDLEAWERWLQDSNQQAPNPVQGRPRAK